MWLNKSAESGLSIAMSDALSEFLVQSVDEVVGDLLGARVRETLYDCLMKQCGLSREQIPDHLENFQRFLNENLGKAGQTLANSIAKRFYRKLGWVFVSIPHHDLVDYVDLARKRTGKSTTPIASPSLTPSLRCR